MEPFAAAPSDQRMEWKGHELLESLPLLQIKDLKIKKNTVLL